LNEKISWLIEHQDWQSTAYAADVHVC